MSRGLLALPGVQMQRFRKVSKETLAGGASSSSLMFAKMDRGKWVGRRGLPTRTLGPVGRSPTNAFRGCPEGTSRSYCCYNFTARYCYKSCLLLCWKRTPMAGLRQCKFPDKECPPSKQGCRQSTASEGACSLKKTNDDMTHATRRNRGKNAHIERATIVTRQELKSHVRSPLALNHNNQPRIHVLGLYNIKGRTEVDFRVNLCNTIALELRGRCLVVCAV